MIELLLKAGPWVLTAIVAAWGVFTHLSAKAKVADAKQQADAKVASAQQGQQTAEENLSARKTADVQADADAAKTAATAAKERTDVEDSQSKLDDTAARADLLRLLHGASPATPGSSQGSSGANADR